MVKPFSSFHSNRTIMKLPDSPLLETKHAHGVIQLILNRPRALNALNTSLYKLLSSALKRHNRLKSTRLLILTGAGNHFCGGMDVKEAASGKQGARGILRAAEEFMRALLAFEKPLIAGIYGTVMGIGVTMLVHFDVVVAEKECVFSTPFVTAGIVAEFGSSVTFLEVLGREMAGRLLMRGEEVGVKNMGTIVGEIVSGGREAVLEKVVEIGEGWSGRFGKEEWEAVCLTKKLMKMGWTERVERAIGMELRVIEDRIDGGEAERGMRRRIAGMGGGRRARL